MKNYTEMDEQFTREEQEAVAHVLFNLAQADYTNHQTENECVKTCLAEIGFDAQGFEPMPRNELQARVYETIKRMSKEKKHIFSRMMTQVSRADGNFGTHEKSFVVEILDLCDVPFVHR